MLFPVGEAVRDRLSFRVVMTESTHDSTVGVILAAGAGARLQNGCKPLTEVAGATLLERAVRTLREAGVPRVVVVVGHAKELIGALRARACARC